MFPIRLENRKTMYFVSRNTQTCRPTAGLAADAANYKRKHSGEDRPTFSQTRLQALARWWAARLSRTSSSTGSRQRSRLDPTSTTSNLIFHSTLSVLSRRDGVLVLYNQDDTQENRGKCEQARGEGEAGVENLCFEKQQSREAGKDARAVRRPRVVWPRPSQSIGFLITPIHIEHCALTAHIVGIWADNCVELHNFIHFLHGGRRSPPRSNGHRLPTTQRLILLRKILHSQQVPRGSVNHSRSASFILIDRALLLQTSVSGTGEGSHATSDHPWTALHKPLIRAV
ncbi:hypothetical protein J6590_033293 [Homalodisca vitripennis]|nr:hypothetical protein J6590_033293 [Homalodisca vitripennis]